MGGGYDYLDLLEERAFSEGYEARMMDEYFEERMYGFPGMGILKSASQKIGKALPQDFKSKAIALKNKVRPRNIPGGELPLSRLPR